MCVYWPTSLQQVRQGLAKLYAYTSYVAKVYIDGRVIEVKLKVNQ
jgi:hypothetical protein